MLAKIDVNRTESASVPGKKNWRYPPSLATSDEPKPEPSTNQNKSGVDSVPMILLRWR